MPAVARRKLTETWREAVARRGRELAREADCLKSFDDGIARGEHEAEAAYRSLAGLDALFPTSEGPVRGRREEV